MACLMAKVEYTTVIVVLHSKKALITKGKLVDGDRWTSRGERYSPSGDTWNGYGTGVDSEGNVYTGKWFFGHTKEEFDELWDEIN